MMSRKNIGRVLLASFFAVAVFGFVAMGDGEGHTHGGCIAATASGVRSCQDSGESAASLLFHIKTFKSFSQALSISLVVLAVFVLVELFALKQLAAEKLFNSWGRVCGMVKRIEGVQLYQRTRARIIYWLALHESRADGTLMGA